MEQGDDGIIFVEYNSCFISFIVILPFHEKNSSPLKTLKVKVGRYL